MLYKIDYKKDMTGNEQRVTWGTTYDNLLYVIRTLTPWSLGTRGLSISSIHQQCVL